MCLLACENFLFGNLSTNLSPSNPKIGTTSDDASAETLSNVVTKSDFNVNNMYRPKDKSST